MDSHVLAHGRSIHSCCAGEALVVRIVCLIKDRLEALVAWCTREGRLKSVEKTVRNPSPAQWTQRSTFSKQLFQIVVNNEQINAASRKLYSVFGV